MDLLAPWKMCLQCLPVFSPQPVLPPPSNAVPLRVTSSKTPTLTKGDSTAENDFQEAEKPSFSDASLTPDHQHQDLPLSDYTKDVDGSLDYRPPVLETNVAENGDAEKHADHDVHSVVAAQAPQDDGGNDKSTPPPSPVTHAPIGVGSILGHHRPLDHIHHQVHSATHSYGHDKSGPPPLHPISDATSSEQHADPPVSSSQSEDDGSDKEAALPHIDDDPSHPQSIPSHVQGLQAPTTPPLETFYSTPADIELPTSTPHGAYDDEKTAMLGSSSTLETSHTEPVDGFGTSRMNRREQFKHQLKDFRNQLKQGGQQLRKEGTKHLQKMMSAKKKQGQPNEKSGSFSSVTRSPLPD